MKGKYIVILIIVIIAATYLGIVLSDNEETKSNKITSNNITNTMVNKVEIENKENKIENNVIVNEVVNEIENTVETNSNNVEINTEEKPVEEIDEENNRINRALEIVKEHWGEDPTIDFEYDGKSTDGKYMVVLRDDQTRNAKFWFYVDVDAGTFEIE